MDMKKTMISYLNPVLTDCREQEQSQEVRIPDGMPDADKVLAVWGQPILRGKEWRGDTVGLSGGVMIWVMYKPEGETNAQTLDAWIPIQSKWGIEDASREGTLCADLSLRFLDARILSPRKLMVRAGLNLWMQALRPTEAAVLTPDNLPADVQVRKQAQSLRLYTEAGEKAFAIEDVLSVPGENISDWKPCGATLRPYLNDQKMVGSKIAFRGAAEVRLLLAPEEGLPVEKTFVFPFSQFAEMEGTYGSEAEAEMVLSVTNLELEKGPDGAKNMKLGLTGQYQVSDETVVQTVADVYSNARTVLPVTERLELTPIMDRHWETVGCRAALPAGINNCVHTDFWNEAPKLTPEEGGVKLEVQGAAQMLYRQEDGPEGKILYWNGEKMIPAKETERLAVTQISLSQPQLEPGKEGMELAGELRCRVMTMGAQGIPMVTDLELGEEQEPDPNRPSLILCRAGEQSLWELAKSCGSTVEAIRQANGLEGEPDREQMLLIPIA